MFKSWLIKFDQLFWYPPLKFPVFSNSQKLTFLIHNLQGNLAGYFLIFSRFI